MEYTFSTASMQLHLQLHGKYNVIVGNSGTGKSYLCTLVEEIRRAHKSVKQQPIPICGGEAAAALIPLWAQEYQGALLVLDELQIPELWHTYLDIMKRSRNYYIICTREGDANIPYGVNTTFILERSPTTIRMVPAYGHEGTRNPRAISSVLTEDSSVGFKVVSEKTELPVHSARGKDNLVTCLRRLSERALVLLDMCGIGASYPRIAAEAKRNRAVVFDSLSFEHEVLRTVFSAVGFDEYPEVCLDYESEEAYYVAALERTLSTLYGIHYSKSSEELVALLVKGKGIVHGKFVDLSSRGGDYTRLYPFLGQPHRPTENLSRMKLE